MTDTMTDQTAVARTYLDALISHDGRSSYVAVTFGDIGDDAAEDAAGRIEDALAGEPDVTLGGAVMVGRQAGSIIGEDLAYAEMLAFPIIFLLSLWVFRGLVAALLPSLMGGLVIFGSFLAIGLFNEAMTLSVYALNLAIGLSLLLVRPLKGLLAAIQFANKAEQGRFR